MEKYHKQALELFQHMAQKVLKELRGRIRLRDRFQAAILYKVGKKESGEEITKPLPQPKNHLPQ